MPRAYELWMQFFGVGLVPMAWAVISAGVSRFYFIRSEPTDTNPFRATLLGSALAAVLVAALTAPQTIPQGILVGLASAAIITNTIRKTNASGQAQVGTGAAEIGAPALRVVDKGPEGDA